MAPGRLLQCLVATILTVGSLSACKDKADAPKAGANAADLGKQCARVGAACGDKDKHMQKITEDCKLAAQTYTDSGCVDQAAALYTCYEKELCGAADKVWALEDLRVLSERHKKCVEQHTAARACSDKKKDKN